MNILIDLSMIIRANYYIALKIVNNDFASINKDRLYRQCLDNIENIVFSISRQHKLNKIILVKDSQENFRKHIYKQYKANRKDDLLMKMLLYDIENMFQENSFYYVVKRPLLEADDLMFLIAQILGTEKCIIVSRDADLFQIGCIMYSPITKQPIDFVFNETECLKKILEGCKSDNVPQLIKPLNKKYYINDVFTYDYGFDDIAYINYQNYSFKDLIEYADFKLNFQLVIFDFITYETLIPRFNEIYDELCAYLQ